MQLESQLQPDLQLKKFSCDSTCNWKKSQLQPGSQLEKKNQLHLHLQLKKLQLKLTTSRATKQIPTKANNIKIINHLLKNKLYTWVMHLMKRIKYKQKTSAKSKLNL